MKGPNWGRTDGGRLLAFLSSTDKELPPVVLGPDDAQRAAEIVALAADHPAIAGRPPTVDPARFVLSLANDKIRATYTHDCNADKSRRTAVFCISTDPDHFPGQYVPDDVVTRIAELFGMNLPGVERGYRCGRTILILPLVRGATS